MSEQERRRKRWEGRTNDVELRQLPNFFLARKCFAETVESRVLRRLVGESGTTFSFAFVLKLDKYSKCQ
jgi:hypothetical protein